MPYATYRFNKIIAAETIRFIVTVAIVVYKGLKLVVYRMLTYETFITQGLQGVAPAVIFRYYAKTGRTAIHRIKLEIVRKMRNLFFHLYNS